MRNSKLSENQIIKALKENQQSRSVDELSRELGIDKSTFCYWSKNFSLVITLVSLPPMWPRLIPRPGLDCVAPL